MDDKNPYSSGGSNNPHGEDPFLGDPMGGLGDFQNPNNPLADEYQDYSGGSDQGYGYAPPGNQGLPGYPTGTNQASGHGLSHAPGYPGPGGPGYVERQVNSRSWVLAAVLAFFLGPLGVHNFYLNYTKKAKWQLGLTIFGYVTLILLIGLPFLAATYIWAFVEFVLILLKAGPYSEDGDGNPLT